MIMISLQARPHFYSVLSQHELAFEMVGTLSADFPSREAKELDSDNFYKKLQLAREGYVYPLPVHHRMMEASCLPGRGELVLQLSGDNLQPLIKYGRPAKVPEAPSLATPTPAYSPPHEDDFPPLSSNTPNHSQIFHFLGLKLKN